MHAKKNKIVSCVKTIYYEIQRIEDKVVYAEIRHGEKLKIHHHTGQKTTARAKK
jgi:hypothetical protein